MSDTNDINFKGTDGDTEGHAFRGNLDDGSQDEAAEGHVLRAGKLDDGSDTDAEGHVSAQQKPGKPRIKI